MKHLLLGYGLVLILILAYSLFAREGFESSPKTVMQDIANKKVLLFVSRSDCGHCNNMKSAWEKAAAKQPDKMVMIDATTDPAKPNPDVEQLLSKLNVTGYPAIFVMDNGQVVKQYEGGRSEQDLLAEVSSM
jgi:thiol-disulfide isomerase/thioredoxin